LAIPEKLEEIHPEDYYLQIREGDPVLLPFAEYMYPCEVFETFMEVREGMERALREFDAVSFYKMEPEQGCSTLVLLSPGTFHRMAVKGMTVITAKFTEMLMVAMPDHLVFAPFSFDI
jgi:hypothetical protein